MSKSQVGQSSKLIFLYGPPASGKSTIGELLAENLALPFIDLDQRIEAETKLTIPEIFTDRGEESFRQFENELIKQIVNLDWGVVALGGGALLNYESRIMVERDGAVVCLVTSPEELLTRVDTASNDRPLLAGSMGQQASGEKLLDLLNQREGHYASFDHQIDTLSKSPGEVAREIQTRLGTFHLRGMVNSGFQVPTAEGDSARPHSPGYDVRVQKGALDKVGDWLDLLELNDPIALVADENVAEFYLHRTQESIRKAGFKVQPVVIPPGEAFKTMDTVSHLWQQFLETGLERRGTVIALGGGVVGDLAGFAAATYKRGVRWVNLPTSLLAMVDASLGGKTGADLPQGKNLVGAFHAPRLVLVDPETLNTLPQDELRSGMAEVVKAGIIGDATLFEKCAQGWREIESDLEVLIRKAMAVKIAVIEADPYEGGLRETLNLGHTIGHAVEVVSNYELRHGEAVAIGMVAEARLAEKIGIAEIGLAKEIEEVCANLGLPVKIPKDFEGQSIIEAMQVDKKRAAGKVRFSLPVEIGKVRIGIEVGDLNSLPL